MSDDLLPSPTAFALDDCWNRIGVRGDGSCPALERYVHCRNCPVYSEAATRLLDAAPPEGYLSEWTRLCAREKPRAESDAVSLFLFRVEAEWLALPAGAIREVALLRPFKTIPRRRDGSVLGLANVRGALLVCLSLGRVLALDRAGDPASGAVAGSRDVRRLVVVEVPGGPLAFPVEEAHGIVRSPVGALKPLPATVAGSPAAYTRAVLPWEGRSVGVLDGPRLFAALNEALSRSHA